MSLLRWSVVMVLGVAGGVSPSTLAAPAPQPLQAVRQVDEPSEPRVEIGPAVVFIYDEAGRIVATE